MNVAILVFIGGAICRELLIVSVLTMNDHFPLDIFMENIIASLLLGIVAGLLMRNKIG